MEEKNLGSDLRDLVVLHTTDFPSKWIFFSFHLVVLCCFSAIIVWHTWWCPVRFLKNTSWCFSLTEFSIQVNDKKSMDSQLYRKSEPQTRSRQPGVESRARSARCENAHDWSTRWHNLVKRSWRTLFRSPHFPFLCFSPSPFHRKVHR